MENSNNLAEVIFSTTHDAVAICDDKKDIIQVNQAFEELTGYIGKDIIGKNLFNLVVEDLSLRKEIVQELENRKEWSGDIAISCQDKELKEMAISSQSLQENPESQVLLLVMFWGNLNCHKKETYYDKLTSLPNNQLFIDRTEQALIAAPRSGKSVALLMIGLDRFVLVNDGLGYATGDQVLKAIAERLNHTIRRSDTAARIEGDRFALVMQITSVEDSVIVAEKILKSLSKSIQVEENTLSVTASVGISIFPTDASQQDTLIKNAESAMRYTKTLGGNH